MTAGTLNNGQRTRIQHWYKAEQIARSGVAEQTRVQGPHGPLSGQCQKMFDKAELHKSLRLNNIYRCRQ